MYKACSSVQRIQVSLHNNICTIWLGKESDRLSNVDFMADTSLSLGDMWIMGLN